MLPREDAGPREQLQRLAAQRHVQRTKRIVRQRRVNQHRQIRWRCRTLHRHHHAMPAVGGEHGGIAVKLLEQGGGRLDALIRRTGNAAVPAHAQQREGIGHELHECQLFRRDPDRDHIGTERRIERRRSMARQHGHCIDAVLHHRTSRCLDRDNAAVREVHMPRCTSAGSHGTEKATAAVQLHHRRARRHHHAFSQQQRGHVVAAMRRQSRLRRDRVRRPGHRDRTTAPGVIVDRRNGRWSD